MGGGSLHPPAPFLYPMRPHTQLSDFLHRHRGESAWVFGKGPSLDKFDYSQAGPLRIGINDLVGVVPGCLYGVSGDAVTDWIDLYQPGQTLFHPLKLAEEGQPLPATADVCLYREENGDDTLLERTREQMCQYLQVRRGSLGRALQILHIMGVRLIHCVGMDGGREYATRAQWRTNPHHTHPQSYDGIRDHFIQGAAALGIEIRFHKGDQPMTNGTTRVRITRDIFINGQPYQSGKIYTLFDPDARDAVAAGGARFEPAPTETATAEPSMETPEKARSPRRKKTAAR